jgi:hypothetical protein
MIRKVNPVIIAKGTDLGNGFCTVRLEWLPAPMDLVAQKNKVVQNGIVVVSNEFVDCPWNARAVYSLDFQTEYTAKDL